MTAPTDWNVPAQAHTGNVTPETETNTETQPEPTAPKPAAPQPAEPKKSEELKQIEELIKKLSDDEFLDLRADIITTEVKRRNEQQAVAKVVEDIYAQNPELNPTHVTGDAKAAAWRQPHGAHDAYIPWAVVRHSDKYWRNTLTVLNVWEPGVYGWEEVDESEATNPGVEKPATPWAPGIDLKADDIVTYGGSKYRVVQPHKTQEDWLPNTTHSLYTRIS